MESSPIPKEKLDFRASLQLDPEYLQTIFLTATDASGETPENFKCNICSQLVWEPNECNKCDHIYCSTCLKLWIDKGKQECPLCRAAITP
jgi:hypothetical protein